MKILFSVLILLLQITAIQAQSIRYVRAGGTGDGSSWEAASGTLQLMINASAPNDEVWVAEGTYTPTHLIVVPFDNSHPPERRSTFTIHPGIKLYGGFPASGNPGMTERDFSQHHSILSGNIGAENDSTDNCYHVMFFPNTSDAVINGFTIKSGTANGNTATNDASAYVSALGLSLPNYVGGGMYLYNASNITIVNCRFEFNRSTYQGGAINSNGGTHHISNCHFAHNRAGGAGGGICGVTGTYTVENCTFIDNHVVLAPGGPFPMPSPGYLAAGGAILVQNADLNLTGSQLLANTAYVALNSTNANGGGVYVTGGVHSISNNEFTANASLHLPTGVQVCQGGAIYASTASLVLSENTFTENLTHGSGGAITLTFGSHTMRANRFTANEAIGLGGALSCTATTRDAYNNIFALNTANNNGGAIHSSFNQGSNRYVNNTFYANSSATEGGAMYFDNRVDHVLNNIFWQNAANGSTTVSFADVRFYNSSGSTLLHNLRQDGSPVNGNIIAQNPQFADASNGDYSLLSSSPCINAGDNAHYLSSYDATDFAGNQRIFNEIIDMGAYELQSASTVSAAHAAGSALLEVYPNPVASGGMLHFVTEKSDVLQVFDLTGKVCYERRLTPGVKQVQLELRPGLYIARLQEGTAIKLVVQ